MERKTKVHAVEGKQELIITREFDLPVELIFKAYSQADLVARWMGTNVLKLESRPHGSYQFETTDSQGNVVFRANGVIHEFLPNQQITRTFEMEDSPFPVQLEYLTFESSTAESSHLTIHIVFKSVHFRDELLKMPFAQGLNMAHNRLSEIAKELA